MDIVEFLTARLDEDEAAAKEHLDKVALAIYNSATAHPRRKPCEDFATLPLLVQERYRALVLESQPAPARVLAEVKAKRAIVADHPVWPPPEMTESELHEHCAHPAYEYATTEGQRKAWDRADEPPEGGGWERNVDAGMPGEGWERFDYTEESYWRRLNSDGPRPLRPPLVLRYLAVVYGDHPDYDPTWHIDAT